MLCSSVPPNGDAKAVRIVEVSPRDGLQNIPEAVPTSVKISLISQLLETGLDTVELTSFVSPRAIPQLADCRQVLSDAKISSLLKQGIEHTQQNQASKTLRLPVLVPNIKGLQGALELNAREVAVFVSASEGFSRANIKCSVQQGLDRAKSVASEALCKGLIVRGYVSCIFVDPFDGPVPHSAVLTCVRQLLDMGCYEISLGDTLGVGVAAQVQSLITYLVQSGIPVNALAGHFHDTYGQAVSNAMAAYKCGIRVFDASVAGLGGCPFAPGARGNVATEDLVYMFHQSGIATGVDLHKLVESGLWISSLLKIPNGSRAGSAIAVKHKLRPSQAQALTRKPSGASRQSMPWSLMKSDDGLEIFRSGSDVKVVLNRPRNGNALTASMCTQLTLFLRQAAKDTKIKCIAITANGKYFCTGMDLGKSTSVAKSEASGMNQFELLTALFEAIDNAPQITIACVQGPAFGGGVGLAFACDVRIATRGALFTLSEVTLGLCPATISKYVIREWGFAFAREAMVSGRPVSPSEILRLGAIAQIVDAPEQLSNRLDDYLLQLDRCAPEAARMCKDLIKVAWADAGGKKQAQDIKKLFKEMMAEDAEAAYGVKQFQLGNKNIDWAAYYQSSGKAKL